MGNNVVKGITLVLLTLFYFFIIGVAYLTVALSGAPSAVMQVMFMLVLFLGIPFVVYTSIIWEAFTIPRGLKIFLIIIAAFPLVLVIFGTIVELLKIIPIPDWVNYL